MESTRLAKLLEFFKNEPNDAFLQYALATEYLNLNETEKALGFYENLIKHHPAYVGTYYHLGKLYEAFNRADDAVKIYELGIEVAGNARDFHALSELKAAHLAAAGLAEDDDY
ncbi:MAG: tetratricopeptide repeat protein [Sphingobacteriaceae bacterium]